MTSSRVTKIRFHAMKIVLDQGLMRYLKKSFFDIRRIFFTDERLMMKEI